MVLTQEDLLEALFYNQKKPSMARFYEMQRKRMKTLACENNEPVGNR